jgi:hypothetical protein
MGSVAKNSMIRTLSLMFTCWTLIELRSETADGSAHDLNSIFGSESLNDRA